MVAPSVWGAHSALREVLEHCIFLIREMRKRPTSIRELVSPHLPHIYGFSDSCGLGCGGVLLPCTEWIPPIVWTVEYPPDIQHKLLHLQNQGGVTVNDGEMVGTVLQALVLELWRRSEYSSFCSFCNNSVSVGQHKNQAARTDSQAAASDSSPADEPRN